MKQQRLPVVNHGYSVEDLLRDYVAMLEPVAELMLVLLLLVKRSNRCCFHAAYFGVDLVLRVLAQLLLQYPALSSWVRRRDCSHKICHCLSSVRMRPLVANRTYSWTVGWLESHPWYPRTRTGFVVATRSFDTENSLVLDDHGKRGRLL